MADEPEQPLKNGAIQQVRANAFSEDRTLCGTAGMDDFAAKPVTPDLLFA